MDVYFQRETTWVSTLALGRLVMIGLFSEPSRAPGGRCLGGLPTLMHTVRCSERTCLRVYGCCNGTWNDDVRSMGNTEMFFLRLFFWRGKQETTVCTAGFPIRATGDRRLRKTDLPGPVAWRPPRRRRVQRAVRESAAEEGRNWRKTQ